MKLNLKNPLMMYETFIHMINEDASIVVDNPTAKVDHRESMMHDVNTIITSLEALSKNIYEDLENIEAEINEAGKDGAGAKLMDWVVFGKKYKKMQGRINQMKLNSADLGFAASHEKDPNKKAVARDKKKQVDVQVKELQSMVDSKARERGAYVQKVLSATKIEGQMAVIKHMTGLEDDPNKKADLTQRMKDLNVRMKEEKAALKELESEEKAKTSKKEEGGEKEVDTSDIRNQMSGLRDEADAEFQKSDKGPEARLALETKRLKAAQLLLKAATLEKDEDLIASVKEDIAESQNYIKELQQEIEAEKAKEEPKKDETPNEEPKKDETPNEEPKKKAEDAAAAKKKAEDEAAAKKKAEDEAAAKKKAEDEAAAKKKAEDKAAAKKKAEDEAAPKESYTYEETLAEMELLNSEVTEEELDEAQYIEESTSQSIMDYIKYRPRYNKMQKRINQMKLNAFDLGFAAANLGRSAEVADKVSALNAKKKMIQDQIDELQALLDDRIKERGPMVKKATDLTRLDGQVALIKHMSGLEDDPNKKASLTQRMKDLKARQEEEMVAMQQIKDDAKSSEVDIKGDDEEIALKNMLTQAKEDKKSIAKEDKIANAQAEIEILDIEIRLKAHQGNTDGVQAGQEKLLKAQQKLADLQSAPETVLTPAAVETPADEAPGDEAPVTDEAPEVKAAKAKIAEYEQAIADLSAKTDKASKDKVAMLTAAAASQRKSLQQLLAPKESLMARAYDLNLQEMVIYINEKENWQLDNTPLYVTINNQIRTAEMNSSLNESIFNTSVKDRMSKLL